MNTISCKIGNSFAEVFGVGEGGLVNTENETEVTDIDEQQETTPYRYEITAYGADYPVDGLVKRLEVGDIVIPTFDPEEPMVGADIEGFQRGFVWSRTQCDRFVESLLLGFPVPGIFLVKLDDRRFLVLDGQQRLRTLRAFYKGILRGTEFSLQNVQDEYQGATYETLEDDDRRRLDNSIIHSTIVRQDEPPGELSSVYMLFERLNTGGTNLQPQEIRVALYRGDLIRLIRDLNDYEAWRNIYGTKSKRLKDQELILRFFALLHWKGEYSRPMKDFLNKYAAANRDLQLQNADELRTIFIATTTVLHQALGRQAFRLKNAINAAVFDSVMVGVALRILADGKIRDHDGLKSQYESLLGSPDYVAAVEKSTADEEQVRTRLRLAEDAMAGIR